jgi:hypothetical protein
MEEAGPRQGMNFPELCQNDLNILQIKDEIIAGTTG